uniref:MATH domain-containing protein n=1 Tax=Angiostrongylus cantonensis TaxID=6313 RepID=A0A0K0CW63_ANGCA
MEEAGSSFPQRVTTVKKRVSVACQTEAPYGTGSHASLDQPNRTVSSGILAANPATTPATSSRATTASPATEEQTLRVTIQHFSKMVDTLCSPCKRINGVPWRIMVMPKQHMVQKKNQKCMGFFLQCCPDNTYSDAWTCQSVAEMRLIAQKPGVQNFVRKTTHVYSAKENDWGYSCFMTWADVLDESQGYIKDDRVTLEITVKAEAPKNMMSREDFRRSIDQWYNLAEMQLARGQVDLSIEANAQALKFCKDKDKQSQEKLEAQRERLVNHKLVEIKDVPKGTGDALRPTSLRQALTGAQKSATTSKATKVIKKERRAIVPQGKKNGSLALKGSERKSGEGEDDNSNSLSSEESKQKVERGEKSETKQNVEARKQRSRSLSDSDTMKTFSRKEMLTDQALLDEEDTGDDHTTSPGSEDNKTIAEQVKENEDKEVEAAKSRNSLEPQNGVIDEKLGSRGDCGDLAHSEDDSSDYGENGIREMCGCGLHHHRDVCHSSISSLEPDDEELDNENYEDHIGEHVEVEMCENGCQTEDSGDMESPQLNALTATVTPVTDSAPSLVTASSPIQAATRERRHAASGINKDSLFRDNVAKMAESTEEVLQKIMQTREQQPQVEKISEADQQRLLQFCIKNFGIDNFCQDMIPPELAGSDETMRCFTATLNAIMQKRLEIISDDHGTCCLASGLCTVHSNRIYKAAESFVKVVEQMFESEILTATFAKMSFMSNVSSEEVPKKIPKTSTVSNGGKSARKTVAAQRRLPHPQAAQQQQRPVSPPSEPPSEFAVSLSEAEDEESIDDFEELHSACLSGEDVEQQMRELLNEISHCRVHDLILDKIESMEKEPNNSSIGLRALLVQLFNYSQTLSVTGDRMETMVAQAREVQQIIQGPDALRAAEQMKRNEEKLAETEAAWKQARADLMKELEHKKKAEQLRMAESSKLKEETAKTEQLTVQLKEARSNLKKMEKKAKQDETRIGSLEAEKFDLEDKVKSLKKELDQVKKKAAEDRSKAKKEKERDAEQVRRLESEALEREGERDRERQQHEEFRRDVKNREQKWEKERKQHISQITALLERARSAEVAQVGMMLAAGVSVLEKTRDEAALNLAEAEDNLKRARTHSDMETMRRSVAEWKCAHDDCVSTISQTRIEFEAACDSIRKGQRTLAQLTDLKVPSPPVLPKVVRLPPVQVVQPSTPACTTIPTSVSAVIQPPPAGVIGQPRTPQSNRYSSHVSPRDSTPTTSNSHTPQTPSSSRSVAGSLSSAPPPTTQLFERSPIKQPLPIGVRPGPGLAPTTLPLDESAVPSAAAPAASPWSWSTPLGSLADIRPLRPASEQAHPLLQQQSHHEIWRNGTTTDSSQVRAPPGYNLGWGGVNGNSIASPSSQGSNQNSSFHSWRGSNGSTAVPPGQPQFKYSPADKYSMQYYDS